MKSGLTFVAYLLIGLLLLSAVTTAQQTKQNTRTEKDLLGEKQIPAEVYYGVQTARALENFQFSGVLINVTEESLKDDADRDRAAFAEAEIAASMGQWDRSVQLYDQILSRNQSTQEAQEKRAYALERLGEEDGSGQSRETERLS